MMAKNEAFFLRHAGEEKSSAGLNANPAHAYDRFATEQVEGGRFERDG
jgi:hypothetical protein